MVAPKEFKIIKDEILWSLDVYKNAKPGYLANSTTHNICVKVVYPLLNENEKLRKKIEELTRKPEYKRNDIRDEGPEPGKENWDFLM